MHPESLKAQLDAALVGDGQGSGWRVEGPARQLAPWLTVSHAQAGVVNQGWKLHVSATADSASLVLSLALPVLLHEPTCFKVAASVDRLVDLNRGDGGRSQVGKFITVYPSTDAQAVRLAVALHEATAGLRGPRVPSDRPLRPGSLVHYRYGGFQERWMQTPLGEVVPAIEAPDGSLVADERGFGFRTPAWAEDPFTAAGVVERMPPVDLVVDGRYLTAEVLGSTAETTVRLVVDLVAGGCRVLKQARRAAGDGVAGDPAVRLRHEAAVLRALDAEPGVPRLHDLFELGDDIFMVVEHVGGLDLETEVGLLGAAGTTLPREQLIALAAGVADILCRLHRRGLVYGDLKSPHVIIELDATPTLIDFESVWPNPDPNGPMVMGTPGYMSPQRAQGMEPVPADDVYGLGALLFFMATGAEPSNAPNRARLLDRPVSLINPSAPPVIVELIERCLDPDPDARPSMPQVRERLTAPPACPQRQRPVPTGSTLDPVRDIAARLCRSAVPDPSGRGVIWLTEGSALPALRDIGGGSAGVVLALAQAAPVVDDPDVWATLRAASRWLAGSDPFAGGPLPGLYVGEAGVALALLRAGEVLADEGLRAAALGKGGLVARLPHTSPDLYNGSAGRLRFHLTLWNATDDDRHLRAAISAGERLFATAQTGLDGQAHWRIPDGFGGATGKAYLGYAHGVAGIADALLDLVQATGYRRFADLAACATRRLLATAVPCLPYGAGLNWPDEEGGQPVTPLWCHGAAGVARFLLRAGASGLVDGAVDAAHGAARAAGKGARFAGPTQCHGLAGNADVLIDAYALTGDRAFLDDAQNLGRLLEAHVVDPDDFEPRSFGAVRSANLMTGWAGLLATFLRLHDPQLPHVMAPPSLLVNAVR